MKVVFLNGGKGTRLGLVDRPKPMVTVAGKPLLEWLVDNCRSSGFCDLIFLNGHMAEVIEAHFGDGAHYGVRIQHVREAEPLGTAGAIRAARALLSESFIVLYGDILIDIDLAHFVSFHRDTGGLGTLFVHPNDHPQDSDLVEVDETGRISRFLSRPHRQGAMLPNLVSAALYVLEPSAIDYVPPAGASDWGRDVFPAIVAAGEAVCAYRSVEYAKDVGTPQRLAKAEADLFTGRVSRLSRRNPKPAIFVDRDGVLNAEISGVHRPQDLVLLHGVGDAIRTLNRAGVPVICATNQPDIAKGLLTKGGLAQVSAALDTALAACGAYLDDLYYCPHHPERGWPGEVTALKVSCDCRKPRPGLMRNAALHHYLDLQRSWMIGDRYADIAAARSAGMKAILVRTGHVGSDRDQHDCTPDYIVDGFSEAVALALRAIA